MSIHYNVAAALLHGDFAESNYVPQHNPDVLKLATLVRLEVDADLTKAFPAKQGAGVSVQTRAGDLLEERVDDVVPTNSDGVRERFVTASAQRLGTKRAKALDRVIATLETSTDAAELARLATLDRA